MGARKLISNVLVEGVWYGPAYPDAGDPPEGSVTDVAYQDESERTDLPRTVENTVVTAPVPGPITTSDGDAPAIPPKTGTGSGREKWAEYAAANSVQHDENASKTDIITACERAGVPTEA